VQQKVFIMTKNEWTLSSDSMRQSPQTVHRPFRKIENFPYRKKEEVVQKLHPSGSHDGIIVAAVRPSDSAADSHNARLQPRNNVGMANRALSSSPIYRRIHEIPSHAHVSASIIVSRRECGHMSPTTIVESGDSSAHAHISRTCPHSR